MRAKRVYTLYKRRYANGTSVWYFRVWVDGRKMAFSTGAASKEAAITYVENYLSNSQSGVQEENPNAVTVTSLPMQETQALPAKEKGITFDQFAKDWWTWDKCEYVINKRASGTPSRPGIKQSYVDSSNLWMRLYLLPFFGNYELTAIDSDLVNKFMVKLSKTNSGSKNRPLAPKTINNIRTVLSVMLGEAKRKKLIHENPVLGSITMTVDKKRKQLLTDKECAALFDQKNIKKFWDDDLLSYSCSYIASLTGLRAGELLALTIDDITPQVIHIKKGYIAKYGLNTTKTSEIRDIPITKEMYILMYAVYNSHPHPAHCPKYIFSVNGNKPMAENRVRENFYIAIQKMGITKEEREKRGITFHSWRHKFNTDCVKANLHPAKIRAVTGHKSNEMLYRYSDLTTDDLAEQINEIQKRRMPSTKAKKKEDQED